MADKVLEIRDLKVHYETDVEIVKAVNGIDLIVGRGESVGLVGETGAGKTTTALSIMQLLPNITARIVSGDILYEGNSVVFMQGQKKREYRGNKISMIFQDPMTALNPVLTVGAQIVEVILLHNKISKQEAEEKAKEMMELVGIKGERFGDYPQQFSGGMKQRVVIAIALACTPELLIADEPTTALDVTIQAQVLELIAKLKEENNTSLILITHDLGVVAETCQKAAIMYAGEIVEFGTVENIFNNTCHPYTEGLFGSIPNMNHSVRRLTPIPGLAPNPANLPKGCKFAARCKYASDSCSADEIPVREIEAGHFVKCLNSESVGRKVRS